MSDEVYGPHTAGAATVHAEAATRGNSGANHRTSLSGADTTQGIKLGRMRYVLGIGLALAVMAGVFVGTFFTP